MVEPGLEAAWSVVYLTRRASRALARSGRVPIAVRINDYPFRTSAFPTGDGAHQITLNPRLLARVRARPGERVVVVLVVDDPRHPVEYPDIVGRSPPASPSRRPQGRAAPRPSDA